MKNVFFIGLLILGMAAGFYFFPQLDIQASRLFFDSEEGFFLKNNVVVVALYKAVPLFVRVFAGSAIFLVVVVIFRKKPVLRLGKRELAYLILALALGPGLVVNTVFKEHFGRARPAQVTEFGGTKQFTPAFVISDQCERNCSFVSGHAAVGFFFITFALLAKKHKAALFILSLLPGIAVSFARMAQGGHFLSDVIFAGLFTFLVSLILYEGIIARIKLRHTNNDNCSI